MMAGKGGRERRGGEEPGDLGIPPWADSFFSESDSGDRESSVDDSGFGGRRHIQKEASLVSGESNPSEEPTTHATRLHIRDLMTQVFGDDLGTTHIMVVDPEKTLMRERVAESGPYRLSLHVGFHKTILNTCELTLRFKRLRESERTGGGVGGVLTEADKRAFREYEFLGRDNSTHRWEPMELAQIYDAELEAIRIIKMRDHPEGEPYMFGVRVRKK